MAKSTSKRGHACDERACPRCRCQCCGRRLKSGEYRFCYGCDQHEENR